MLTVVALISLLAGVVYVGVAESLKTSRDQTRKADVEQLQLALRLYVDAEGASIDCGNGIKIDGSATPSSGDLSRCADAQEILNAIAAYFGEVPADPLGPGDPDYYYYFDAVHNCQNAPGGTAAMVFASNLETLHDDSNPREVCGNQAGNDGGYVSTPNIDPSRPYVKLLNFVQ